MSHNKLARRIRRLEDKHRRDMVILKHDLLAAIHAATSGEKVGFDGTTTYSTTTNGVGTPEPYRPSDEY